MSNEEIIKVLEQERACVARQGEEWCDRDCARCDLVMDDKVILEAYDAAIALLRAHPDAQSNEPLTLDELRGMVRQPIWMECKHFSGWAILHLAWPEIYVSAADGNTYFIWANGEYNERLGAKLYRRPPKEEHHEETP